MFTRSKKKQNGEFVSLHNSATTISSMQQDILFSTIEFLEKKISRLEKKLAQVKHFAYHDELTGLPNRSLLRDRLSQAIYQAARHGKYVGLILLDLNSFKSINDCHGHHIGDALLIQVAKRLTICIRVSDSVYRYGGDEFVILVPCIDSATGPTELVAKLYNHLGRRYLLDSRNLTVTASIGMAIYPTDGCTQKALLRQADIAMYHAKSNTGNGSHTEKKQSQN